MRRYVSLADFSLKFSHLQYSDPSCIPYSTRGGTSGDPGKDANAHRPGCAARQAEGPDRRGRVDAYETAARDRYDSRESVSNTLRVPSLFVEPKLTTVLRPLAKTKQSQTLRDNMTKDERDLSKIVDLLGLDLSRSSEYDDVSKLLRH